MIHPRLQLDVNPSLIWASLVAPAGKKSIYSVGDLGSVLVGRSPGERLTTPVFWPGGVHGLYSPLRFGELDMTEATLSLSLSFTHRKVHRKKHTLHRAQSSSLLPDVCLTNNYSFSLYRKKKIEYLYRDIPEGLPPFLFKYQIFLFSQKPKKGPITLKAKQI